MGKVLEFLQRRPFYCAEDFRCYVGFTIEEVISDENDCNAKLILKNAKTNKRAVLDIERALDGETVFALER
ncbi:hypothetical protein [Roseburia hominis]|uniref:hypothetical protein n=1 Tax=Roseburia hominis TaxID=301301 RepID=UPI0022DFDCCF|nr:hypothetical protein [Roseburia hominis]